MARNQDRTENPVVALILGVLVFIAVTAFLAFAAMIIGEDFTEELAGRTFGYSFWLDATLLTYLVGCVLAFAFRGGPNAGSD